MDQKFLRVSVSPHIHSAVTTQRLMLDVCIALLPALLFSFWLYGWPAVQVVVTSVLACVFFEYISRILMKRKQTVQDLSAVVTGLLLAFCLPTELAGKNLYMVVVGAFIAIVVVKQFFGGIGMNFVNPALVGRIALSVSFAQPVAKTSQLSSWAADLASQLNPFDALNSATVDAVTSSSPMQVLKGHISAGTLSDISQVDLVSWKFSFLGLHAGSIGEVSILCLLLGLIYLLVRKVISWHIPVVYIATTFVLMFLFSHFNVQYTVLASLNGGLFLGAIFMATDYTTCPATVKGKVFFALGCGILNAVIRFFGNLPEGTMYSIVLMNILVPYLNAWTRPTPFGEQKKSRFRAKWIKKKAGGAV